MLVRERSGITRIRRSKRKATGTTQRRRSLFLEALEDRRLLAAEPTVTLSVPADPFIGTSPLVIQATFDNTSAVSTEAGYGPFIDIVFPVNGEDGNAGVGTDGISPLSPLTQATYLGQSVTTTQLTFPNDGGGTGCVAHPYAVDDTGTPLQVCGTAEDILVVVQLPFGSFTPGQPPATIELEAALSNFADLGVGLPFTARGGFQFGSDPLNNPSVDPSIFLNLGDESPDSTDWTESATTTPTVIRMTKTYVGPENETATGPNFPQEYQLTVDIAPGQPITDLTIIDGFDNNIVVTGISFSPAADAGTIPTTPFGPSNVSYPSELVVGTIGSITGDPDVDVVEVVVTIGFYIPEFDADSTPAVPSRIIPINGQDPVLTDNRARSEGTWTPIDTRDLPPQMVTAEPDPNTPAHTLQDKSIAIQKSVAVVGGGNPAPGKQLEYTLTFQISDYYTFGDLVITDTISDGQDFLASPDVPVSAPTFTVSDRDGTTAGTFAITFPPDPGDDLTHSINGDGTETLVFDLFQAMQTAGDDGILVGGLATAADDFNIPPVNAGLRAPATGTVIFRVVIPNNYDLPQPSGDDFIAHGDALSNEADIEGTVRDNGAPGSVIGTESDDTAAEASIQVGAISKSIYAVNGVYPPPPGFTLAPGDDLTYSIQYTLPITSFVNFSLNDFLPLPVFNVMDPLADGSLAVWTFNDLLDPDRAVPPAAGVVELGPNDTLYDYTGAAVGPPYFSPPKLDTNAAANSLSFTYGSYDSASNTPHTVQLLFTITASDRPFADGLFLTNIVQAQESNSVLESSTEDAIIQFPLGQPALGITKGVVATDHPIPPAAFDSLPVGPAGVTFNPPGSASSFTGTVTSDGLADDPIDSNLQDIDAGDLVTFAIVVENTGSSRKGAFNVRLRDTLPPGFRIPTAGESVLELNLQVRDGTGAVIDWDPVDGTDTNPLFEDGIQLVDPGPTDALADGTNGGALDQYSASDGQNILVLTYDLIAETSVQPRETITNTATLLAYAGEEGGDNHVAPTDQPADEAEVTIAAPAIDKTIIDTNQTHTSDPDVAIGEIVTYEVVLTVPEGTMSNAVLVDVLDSGLAFVDMVGITALAGVTTNVVGGFNAVASGVAVANVGGGAINDGRQITLNFGTVTNADTNDAVPETITVTYRAVVLNTTNNNRDDLRNNQVEWRWQDDFGPQNVQDSADDVQIVEPTLEVIKEASPLTGQRGDTITFTIEVRHTAASDTDGFDVVLTDLIPADMTYAGSLSNTGGVVPTSLSESGGTVTVIWDTFPDGGNSFIKFDVTLDVTVTPGEVITNNAGVTWTSLPGNVTTPQSTYNTLSTERTGDPANPGGAANDYRATDPASVRVVDPEILDKTIVQTSESHTAANNVAIGEIVRYRLRATMIEGTMPNAQFVDRLQPGLSFLDLSQVKVWFDSHAPITSPDPGWDLGGANGEVLPPTFVMPASRITVAGQQITFDFGTLVNNDDDAGDEIVVLEFNALVQNTSATNNGNNKSNVFDLRVGERLVDTSDPINVRIREPAITNLNKQILSSPPYDAGDPVTYRVTYSNTGATDAFDVRVLDTLNSTYLTLSLPPAIVLAGGAGLAHDNSVGNTLDVLVDRVPFGGSVTITYTATLKAAVEPNLVVANTANLTYTSLPGPNGTVVNPTGSSTPGVPGASDGERDGSGGVNDYRGADSENVSIQAPAFSKTLTATNQVHTDGLDVAIGEIVTYEAVITVPEGTMPNAVVVDTPDAGLVIVAVDSITPSNLAALSTDAPGGFPQVRLDANAEILLNSGSSVRLDLGTLTNTDTDSGVAETITITYRAVVLNTAGNARNVDLDNSAQLTWNRGTLTDTADPVTIVEPALSITKLNGDPLLGDAGDVITFEILVQHAPTSDADAFDVQLVDLINSVANKMTYYNLVPVSVANAGGATLAPGSPDDTGGDLTITWSEFPWGATSTITFQVALDGAVTPNEILTNTADLTWTSLPGDVTTPQSSNPNSVERTGNPAGPGQVNNYRASDSGIVATPVPSFDKVVIDTSEPSTGSDQHNLSLADLTIGETVTFALIATLIDGTNPGVVVTDNLPFTPGVLEFVSATLVRSNVAGEVGSDLFSDLGLITPIVLPTPTFSDSNGDGIDDQYVFDFGTIYNRDDAETPPAPRDELVITIEARAINLLPSPPAPPPPPDTEANQDGMQLQNSAFLTVNGASLPPSTADVEIVEPDLNVTKVTDKTVVDGGDTVTFTITVEHTDTSTAEAFDVTVSDVIPAGLTYAGNVVAVSGPGPAVSLALPTVTFSWNTIPLVAGPYTFTFDVTVDATITPTTTFLNVAELDWSTLPGTDSNERTYTDDDPADLIGGSTTAQNPAKTLAATSEPSTAGADVAVGEIVRYRLQVELTEGTFPSLSFVDTLPLGLSLLDLDQVKLSFTSDVPMTVVEPPGLPALEGANGGAVPPTFVLPAGFVSTVTLPSGEQRITFGLGDVTNHDNDVNVEFVTLEYNALVTNTAAVNNSNVKSNAFQVFVNSVQFGTTQSASVTVREPSITDVQKTVISGAPVDAGDPVTYEVSYSNTGPAAAFDVRLLDVLNPLWFASVSVDSITLDGGASGATDNTAGTTVDVTVDTVPVDATVTVRYTGILSVNDQPGQTIPNTADVTYTSLPGGGTPVGPDNPTGSQTPGGPGDPDGERDGSDGVGGVNDYTDSDGADVTLTGGPAFAKSLAGSTQPYTADPQLTIGEQASYELVLTVPEGTLPGVLIADAMPAGLALVAFDSIMPSSGALTTDVGGGFAQILVDANTGLLSNNTSFSLDFGTLTNSDTNDLATETLTIVYRAVVQNVPANVSGQPRTNDASFTWTGGTIDDAVTIAIVEPDLNVTKDTNKTLVDGGDTITFTITVDHTLASTAWALDVAVADTLPAGLTYAGNVKDVSGPAPAVTVAGQDLTFSWASLPLGAGPYTFTFDVTVDATITPTTTFLNVAELEWSTLPGADPNERTYTDDDPADLISSSTTLRDPAKSLIVTSESSTLGSNVAIGEIVRYRLQAELTEGTFPNLSFVDTLPLGLSLLDVGQVKMSFTSGVPMTVLPPDQVLQGANGGAMPPTFVLPAGYISTTTLLSGQQQITFDLGTVTNHDNDVNAELVTLEFNVLVDNTVNDQAGQIKSNAFQAFVEDVQYGVTQSVDVTIVEPLIADVAKQFVSMSGNQRTFRISFSNTGTATAFNTLVQDVIPAGASLNVGSISVTLGAGASGASTAGSTAGLLQVSIDQMLPVDGTVLIQYTLTLTAGSQMGLVNAVAVTTTSLPGLNGTTENPTGSSTPGAPGDASGERTGSGGVNNYADGDNETLGSLGDLVWHDLNANGVPEFGEPGLPNVDVTAIWAGGDGMFGTADDVTLTTTTNASGIYYFNALPPGAYRVTVDTADIPAPLIPCYDLDGTLDSTTVATLGVGQNRDDVDFGYTEPSTITGVKYSDTDGDGVRDPGEPPIANVQIYIDANNNRALDASERTTVTDASGSYTFGNLLPGTYIVRELWPDYTVQTAPGGSGAHTVVIVVPGTIVTDISFGNQPVAPQIIDDGDSGFEIVGGWQRARCWIFYQSDAQYLCSETGGTGSNYVEWQFGGLVAGATYRVSTTWYPASGLSQDAPFTVFGGAAPVTAIFDQTRSPSTYDGSFQEQGVWWADIDPAYTLQGTTLVVRLSDDHSGGCLLADAVRIIQDTTPEITLLDGSAELTSGSSTVNLGSTIPGTPLLRTFTVRNDGGADLALGTITLPAGYSLVAPFPASTLAPNATTTFTVRLNAVALGTYAGVITLGNNDNDEAPFTFNIVGLVGAVNAPNPQPSAPAVAPPPPAPVPPAPLRVLDGGTVLLNGTSNVSFGTFGVATTANRTFTVQNPVAASSNILLGTIVPPTGFTVVTGFGDLDLSPGESTTFVIGMNTSSSAVFSARELRLNDLLGNSLFTFTVSGAVQGVPPLPAPLVIDNGTGVTGFASSGMTYVTTSGYKGDINYTRGDNTGDNATWTFTGLPSGTYLISTTWVKGTSRASNAPYTLTGVTGGPTTVLRDQKIAPNDLTWDGVAWEHLGTFSITSGTLTVRLTDNANGYVYADAVRVEQLSPLLAGAWDAGWAAVGTDLPTPSTPAAAVDGLTAEAVETLSGAAIARWVRADVSAEHGLAGVQVRVADLPAGVLGLAAVHSQTIWVDVDADGQGWFIDATPGVDEEFAASVGGPLQGSTVASRGGVDLLTVLTHELGHLLGYEDDYDDGDGESNVMDHALPPGTRRLPLPAAAIPSDGRSISENSVVVALWPSPDGVRKVRAERREAAGTRTDAGLTALLAEQPAVWAPADEELARLTATPRKRVDDPEQRLDDVLSSVGDWLDPLDEILSFAKQAR